MRLRLKLSCSGRKKVTWAVLKLFGFNWWRLFIGLCFMPLVTDLILSLDKAIFNWHVPLYVGHLNPILVRQTVSTEGLESIFWMLQMKFDQESTKYLVIYNDPLSQDCQVHIVHILSYRWYQQIKQPYTLDIKSHQNQDGCILTVAWFHI
jgi:hypothetical protein